MGWLYKKTRTKLYNPSAPIMLKIIDSCLLQPRLHVCTSQLFMKPTSNSLIGVGIISVGHINFLVKVALKLGPTSWVFF